MSPKIKKLKMSLEVIVKIKNKKKGDEKIERMLEKEAVWWLKFVLSPAGLKVMDYLYGEEKSAKLKIAEKENVDELQRPSAEA